MIRQKRLAIGTVAGVLCAGSIWAGPIQTEDKKIERGDETSLVATVDFGAGSLDIHKGPSDLLLDATLTYDRKYVRVYVDYRKRHDRGHLELASDLEEHRALSGHLTNEWDVGFSDALPLELTLDIGAAEAQADLSGLSITQLDLDVGAAEAEVWWDAPNPAVLEEINIECGASSFRMEGLGHANFEQLDFEGGVGSFEVDFGGHWQRSAEADFEIGLGSLELSIPEDLAVRIEADDAFLSSVDVDRHFHETDDGIYETDHFAQAAVQLTIRIELGMGSVDIRAVRP